MIKLLLIMSMGVASAETDARHPLICRLAVAAVGKYRELKALFPKHQKDPKERRAFELSVDKALRHKFFVMIEEFKAQTAKLPKQSIIAKLEKTHPISNPMPYSVIRKWVDWGNGKIEKVEITPEVESKWNKGWEPLSMDYFNAYRKDWVINNITKQQHDYTLVRGEFENFIMGDPTRWTSPVIDFKAQGFDFLHTTYTPIGHYGLDFARSLLRTTQVLITLAYETMPEAAGRVKTDDPDLIDFETARGMQLSDAAAAAAGPLATFVEGVISIHQVVTQLTAEKIEGFDNGNSALRAIVESGHAPRGTGVLSDFTRRIPMGVLGPITLQGKYFESPLKFQNGRLSLSERIKGRLKTLKDHFILSQSKFRIRGVSLLSCPVATCIGNEEGERTTGIETLLQVYYDTFLEVEKRRTSDSGN